MQKIKLGKTNIEVSKLGIGTGTAHPSGRNTQALMDRKELADLLIYAFDQGINFWDTAITYETHLHLREALRHIRRSDVVITTKLNTTYKKETERDFEISLKELAVDYIDVCLVHGVRTESELKKRRGALDLMLELKEKGVIRAVGISSHGLSALRAVAKIPEIDVVWVRVNYARLCMDTHELGLYDRLASISWLKKVVKKIIPPRLISVVRPHPESTLISEHEQKEVEDILKVIHSQSKGIVGMKVLAEGRLRHEAQKAVKYVNSLPYIDSFIIGMLNKKEIEENCKTVNGEQ
jgi:predicted aldo/keto reductase-like oxidoreductase